MLSELRKTFASKSWPHPPSRDLESILGRCMGMIVGLASLIMKLKSDAINGWGGHA